MPQNAACFSTSEFRSHTGWSDLRRVISLLLVSVAVGAGTAQPSTMGLNSPGGGELDCSFICGGFIDDEILAIAVQPDGKVLIAGEFSTVHGAVRGRIARLHADGTTDLTFMNGLSGADDCIRAIALQSDGKILVGGEFTSVNDVSRRGIARLHSDGTLDSDFQNGLSGLSGFANGPLTAYSVVVQSDGKVLVGGAFTLVNGVTRNGIARLNADGSLDTGFQNGLSGTSEFGSVYALALQSDGRVLIGGGFSQINDVIRYGIARLHPDGSLDSSFESGTVGTVCS